LGGLEPVPRRIKAAEVQLTGASPTEDAFCNAARVAADEIIPLDADREAAQHRRDLAEAVVLRALAAALS
ncbi:MAG: hypothetical protein AAGJ94_07425, partial [Pseudomonadota bacterium]